MAICATAKERGTGHRGRALHGWPDDERRALIAGARGLPDDVAIVSMQRLAWQMSELVADHNGLSTLGAEAVAATVDLDGRLLVSMRDDGPGIWHCCLTLGVRYHALTR